MTGIKLVYWFTQMNRQSASGENHSQVLYCGPSNSSVDVAASEFSYVNKIIINSLYLYSDRRTDKTKKKQYNNKFTIVKVNVYLQSSVQVWFNSNIVLVIKFLSKC